MNRTPLQPDLTEARRLLGAGMRLVELVPYTKRPAGNDWNHNLATEINPEATGYGLLLAENKLCSVDPDDVERARIGLAALGLDLEAIMAAGVRTHSTRPGSGGRSTFAAEGDLSWLKFSSPAGTAIEFRAESPNLQDCVPGVVYHDKSGRLCQQVYANCKRLDDAPTLPDDLCAWWQRCSTDIEFLRDQQRRFFEAIGERPHLAISTGKGTKLAFEAPGLRSAFNAAHDVESILTRHGYTYDRRIKRWAPPTATGAPGIRPIPGKRDLWRSDHASDPLHGTFDAWTAFVVLDHQGDIGRARAAFSVPEPTPPDDDRFPPIEVYGAAAPADAEEPPQQPIDGSLFITADALRGQAFASPEPIIEDLLLVGATLVHGPAKKGKSWLLLQMATTIDGGGTFLTRQCRRVPVLYIGAEDTSARFKARLERMAAWGTVKFMNRDALTAFGKHYQRQLGEERPTAQGVIEKLWDLAGRPGAIFVDTQEVFEVITGIAHGKQGDSITRRDYQATSSYDAIAQKLGIAVVLVGHWGEIKSIEKATSNPHECLNTTKARLAGVITSVTLGPLPNQEPGESTRDMQLSVRSRDIAEGDQFLWVNQSELTGLYTLVGKVREVLVTEAQGQLFDVLIAAYRAHGPNHWTTAKELADALDVSPQAVKQMVGRVRRSAKAKGRPARMGIYELDSKPSAGYRVRLHDQGDT